MRQITCVLACAALLALASCGGSDGCDADRCEFKANVTACVSKAIYKEFGEELLYINKTRDTSRVWRFYDGGHCKRFPEGTRVVVLERGLTVSKIRFVHRTSEPDMWIAPEMLADA